MSKEIRKFGIQHVECQYCGSDNLEFINNRLLGFSVITKRYACRDCGKVSVFEVEE